MSDSPVDSLASSFVQLALDSSTNSRGSISSSSDSEFILLPSRNQSQQSSASSGVLVEEGRRGPGARSNAPESSEEDEVETFLNDIDGNTTGRDWADDEVVPSRTNRGNRQSDAASSASSVSGPGGEDGEGNAPTPRRRGRQRPSKRQRARARERWAVEAQLLGEDDQHSVGGVTHSSASSTATTSSQSAPSSSSSHAAPSTRTGSFSVNSTTTSGEIRDPRRRRSSFQRAQDEEDVENGLFNEDDGRSDMTDEIASDSITNFLTNTAVFTSLSSNKLVLWQALCVELGLCLPPASSSYAPSSFSNPSSRSPSPTPTASSTSSQAARRAITPTRSTTPTQDYYPFPTSLKKAKDMLKREAFVNLKDYLEMRLSFKEAPIGQEELARRKDALKGLRFGSKSALKRYTLHRHRFIRLGHAKEEWLDPLLVEMIFR